MANSTSQRLDNDDIYFMAIALQASKRSKDANTQVGANVNEERVISTGYNGFPRGCHDQEFPWKKNKEKDKIDPQTKDPYVCHAELNTIVNIGEANIKDEGIVLYVTRHPCKNCALLIIHAGIKKVMYMDKDDERDSKSIELLEQAGMVPGKVDKEKVEAELESAINAC